MYYKATLFKANGVSKEINKFSGVKFKIKKKKFRTSVEMAVIIDSGGGERGKPLPLL